MNYDKVYHIPLLVRTLSFLADGWIVGGGAAFLADWVNDPPRDWDVVVPPEKWSGVIHIVPPGTVTNRWGGFKIDNVDFWPEDLGHFMSSVPDKFRPFNACHLRSLRTVECI